jgi:FKBP-type peptidyl-prolyl cis-trans isomerase
MKAVKEAEMAAKAAKSLEEGQAFLAENATKEGVVALESGLQYKVEKMGEGDKPALEDRVKVHYTGKLLNGEVFDSSMERGEPAVFGLRGVIKGWTEILQLMPVGSKWTVYIPSDLAYGERGGGDKIPGNSTLIFDIELLEIVK